MIKEALEYIRVLGFQTIQINGFLFADKQLVHTAPPEIDCVTFKEPSSFAAFVGYTIDKKSTFILVNDTAAQFLSKELKFGFRRDKYAELIYEDFKHDEVCAILRKANTGVEILG